jgi:hypothetical protein
MSPKRPGPCGTGCVYVRDLNGDGDGGLLGGGVLKYGDTTFLGRRRWEGVRTATASLGGVCDEELAVSSCFFIDDSSAETAC